MENETGRSVVKERKEKRKKDVERNSGVGKGRER